MERLTQNNLMKECFLNSWTVIAENGNAYEIENIKIYSDCGVICETGRGWFGSNNDLGSQEIDTIYLKRSIDLTKKINFIIKEEKNPYRFDHNYTLYIYYKDSKLNFKFLGFNLSNFWLESKFSVYNNYTFDDVLGSRNKKSDSIKYNELLEVAYKKFDSYRFANHYEEIEEAIKTIKKYHKLYEEQKEKESKYTVKDYQIMLYENGEGVKPIDLIKNIELTYNIKIGG